MPQKTSTLVAEPRSPRSCRGPEQRLHRRYARTHDADARDRLVRRYLPLARYAASRYARGSESFDDLLQVASLGLLKALDRYDPERGIAFTTYAMPTMTGELRRHFRDRSWAVRPPRDLQELAMQVERVSAELQRDLGRSPTVGEVAQRLSVDDAAVLEAREALGARTTASLAAPAGEASERSLEARFGRDDEGYRTAEHRATIATLARMLTPRERELLRLRFDEDLTQVEIGKRVGVSQMQVSRTLRAALDKLRQAADVPL